MYSLQWAGNTGAGQGVVPWDNYPYVQMTQPKCSGNFAKYKQKVFMTAAPVDLSTPQPLYQVSEADQRCALPLMWFTIAKSIALRVFWPYRTRCLTFTNNADSRHS